MVSPSIANEYRDAEWAYDCDVPWRFATGELVRNWRVDKASTVKESDPHLGKRTGKYASFRNMRFQNPDRRDVFRERQAELATDVGVNLGGDYDQRRTGRVGNMHVPNAVILLSLGNGSHFVQLK